MNENELNVVKEYKVDNTLIAELDSVIDKCFRDSYNNYFHIFKYRCIYDIKLKNIADNEIIYLSISDKSMRLYELNKKLTVARERGFRFSHINKLAKKFYPHLPHLNISYYLKSQISMCNRQFFRVLSQNRDHLENFCNGSINLSHFACQKRINQLK